MVGRRCKESRKTRARSGEGALPQDLRPLPAAAAPPAPTRGRSAGASLPGGGPGRDYISLLYLSFVSAAPARPDAARAAARDSVLLEAAREDLTSREGEFMALVKDF